MNGIEVYATESNGRRLVCEREETDDAAIWPCFAEISMPIADLITKGFRMGVDLAREYVRSGICDAALVRYIPSRKGVRDIVRVYERPRGGGKADA